MRTETYLYDELPTEKAKKAARNWWRWCEFNDPSWIRENQESRNAVIHAVNCGAFDPKKARDLKYTGYCDDAIAADVWDSMDPSDRIMTNLVVRAMSRAYAAAWREEMKSRENREYIEEVIRVNEYEFHEDGTRA